MDPVIESYSAGKDVQLDGQLFGYELASSMAHAKMLSSINILSEEELSAIESEIKKLYRENGDHIELAVSDEDIHSKLEALLIERIGDTGKKLHTGRSRNDQVMVVMRLYMKREILALGRELTDLLETMLLFIRENGDKILPGYTHTKHAMLMNVRMWVGSFVESEVDNITFLRHLLELVDSNPLGSGSGFGVPIPLDREMTTKLLGFSRVQQNPMYVQNSRGKFEALVIDGLWGIMNDFSRLAADLLTFNMDELLLIETDSAITTGSSIMPQKRNLDVMELVRARTSLLTGYSVTIKSLINGLHSGYNRDLQETKEPLMNAFRIVRSSVQAVRVVIEHIDINEQQVKKSLSKGIFATDLAFQAVAEGMPFRDAYRMAAKKMNDIEVSDSIIRESIEKRVSPGSPATLDVEGYRESIESQKEAFSKALEDFDRTLKQLIE